MDHIFLRRSREIGGGSVYHPLYDGGVTFCGEDARRGYRPPLRVSFRSHEIPLGQEKPYIFAAAPVLFLSFILLWTPPVSGTSAINAVYLAVILFFYYVSYTAVLIPWFAVLPEMSPNNDDRVKIASIGVAIGIIGALIAGGISGPLFNARGIFIMALILGAIAFVASELTLFRVHERHRLLPGEEAPGFIRTVRELFSDKQVLSFSAMIMFVQLTYQLLFMNIPYVVTLSTRQGKRTILNYRG